MWFYLGMVFQNILRKRIAKLLIAKKQVIKITDTPKKFQMLILFCLVNKRTMAFDAWAVP